MEPNTRPTRLRPSVDPYDASCTSDLVLCDEALALFGPGEPIGSCTDEGGSVVDLFAEEFVGGGRLRSIQNTAALRQ
jgi:hypothetical protein